MQERSAAPLPYSGGMHPKRTNTFKVVLGLSSTSMAGLLLKPAIFATSKLFDFSDHGRLHLQITLAP